MTNSTKSTTSFASSLLWNLAFLALGVLLSVVTTLNTINNTDGLVMVGIVIAGSIFGAVISTFAIAFAGEGKFKRYAIRSLLFCVAAACTIIANGLIGQF